MRRLSLNKQNNGYIAIRYQMRVLSLHRAIYAKFHGPLIKGMVINHKDGNPTNNKSSNLEQISFSENTNHAINILKRGSAIKLNKKTVKSIRKQYMNNPKKFSFHKLKVKHGVEETALRNLIRNEKWIDPTYKYIPRHNTIDEKQTKRMIEDLKTGKYTKKELSKKHGINYSTVKAKLKNIQHINLVALRPFTTNSVSFRNSYLSP